jgi:curved DNA-binding protein CbpA
MTSPLPPDPYKTLGVPKDAEVSAIKSAYRKLVLQCHPDKVQDAELKAIKQDEFQKVQQAYELLSDEVKRAQYDDQVRHFTPKRDTSRNVPPGKSVFDYEIRTAEPRSAYRPKPTRVYAQSSPRSYEDDLGPRTFDEPMKARARKTASYEERKRPSTREDEKRRRAEEEREHYERWEKEAKRATHSASKKSRDKERKRGTEEKQSRTTGPYVEDDDSDDAYRPRVEKWSAREESSRVGEKARRDDPVLTDRTRKLDAHKDFAAQYITRRKATDLEADFRAKPRRAETFQEQSYTIRYASPLDDDSPRRSSARNTPRRSSEEVPIQIPIRNREPSMSSGKERKGSVGYEREPFIVEAAPPSPTIPGIKKPTLQTHSSAPPIIPNVGSSRKEPHRSKTTMPEYSRRDAAVPPLPRAATFQSGDKVRSTPKGSKLKRSVEYASDGSESDSPIYSSPRPVSPSPRRREAEPVRYIIEKGRMPIREHRSELREDSYSYPRERSESPRGGRRSADRPPLARTGGSGSGSSAHPSFSRGGFHPGNLSPEPIIKEVRPKISPNPSTRAAYFGEVKFSPTYKAEHVSFAEPYRRGSDPTHHRAYAYVPRPGREAAYA